ncbi:hypothetical protein [Lacticaseibacillus sp. GG6-2]
MRASAFDQHLLALGQQVIALLLARGISQADASLPPRDGHRQKRSPQATRQGRLRRRHQHRGHRRSGSLYFSNAMSVVH